MSCSLFSLFLVSFHYSVLFKLKFHDADTDTDIIARILADTSDTDT